MYKPQQEIDSEVSEISDEKLVSSLLKACVLLLHELKVKEKQPKILMSLIKFEYIKGRELAKIVESIHRFSGCKRLSVQNLVGAIISMVPIFQEKYFPRNAIEDFLTDKISTKYFVNLTVYNIFEKLSCDQFGRQLYVLKQLCHVAHEVLDLLKVNPSTALSFEHLAAVVPLFVPMETRKTQTAEMHILVLNFLSFPPFARPKDVKAAKF